MLILLLVYLFIGVVITELTANIDEEYEEYIHSDFSLYLLEIITWLPDMFNYFLNNDDYEK